MFGKKTKSKSKKAFLLFQNILCMKEERALLVKPWFRDKRRNADLVENTFFLMTSHLLTYVYVNNFVKRETSQNRFRDITWIDCLLECFIMQPQATATFRPSSSKGQNVGLFFEVLVLIIFYYTPPLCYYIALSFSLSLSW